MNERITYLNSITQNKIVIEEILFYCQNGFKNSKSKTHQQNNYLEFWKFYKKESEIEGVINTLNKYFYQFLFPIQNGISSSDSYKKAVLKGVKPRNFNAHSFVEPKNIFLDIYNSPLGEKTPVITAYNTEDFNSLIRIFCYKNEPLDIPDSMGAIFVNGINNWHRINELKKMYLQDNSPLGWAEKFMLDIVPNHNLYKDKLVILSAKPYSGITHSSLGISHESWIKSSIEIRREHECAHLFTLKNYKHMAINMHDEIIADYVGITKVLGNFDKKWFYHFVGIHNYPRYKTQSRLENYVPSSFSEEAFFVLMTILKDAAFNIENFDKRLGEIRTSIEWVKRIKCLCETDLLEMCLSSGSSKLIEKYNSFE